jgi:hypothetical protein
MTPFDCRNPINAIRHQYAAELARQNAPPEPESEEEEEPQRKRRYIEPEDLKPTDLAYWAQGYGKGGEKPWRFECICGEKCSSYENYRYHPIGRMYECTHCSLWSHVDCVLGNISDEELEELPVSAIHPPYLY